MKRSEKINHGWKRIELKKESVKIRANPWQKKKGDAND
jgi:hypothetical protein